MRTNISGRMDLGIMTLDPLNKTPFWADSSSRYAQYSLMITGTSSLVSGQPVRDRWTSGLVGLCLALCTVGSVSVRRQ